MPTPEVEPIGRFLYRVRSRSAPSQSHTVDLTANNGFGECTCVHWMCRVGPFIKNKGSTWEDHRAACYHVTKARNHLIRGVLTDFAKQEMAR